jgi:hypothetical protein
MRDHDHASIPLLLSESPGIQVSAKGDGRVEIPRSIVRVMGWKEMSTILLHRDPQMEIAGMVAASIDSVPRERRLGDWLLGGATVSMGRVRIPLSVLKKAEMDGMDLVIVAEEDRVVVRPNMRMFREHMNYIGSLIRRFFPKHVSLRVMADILAGKKSVLDHSSAVRRLIGEEEEQPRREPIPGVFPAVDMDLLKRNLSEPEIRVDFQTNADSDPLEPPTLVMPAPGRPVVARIVGNPYQFRAHWMTSDVFTNNGQLALCGPLCTACAQRKPDTLWLAPAIVSESGVRRPGFLLAQTTLIRKVARALKDKDRDRTDVIIYHRPWNEGMCAVYTNPPEKLPAKDLETARLVCAHPDVFLAAAFQEASEIQGYPARSPMLITAANMEFVPELKAAAIAAKAAAGTYTEEALLDKLVDELENGSGQ